jgi:hypothetical protein
MTPSALLLKLENYYVKLNSFNLEDWTGEKHRKGDHWSTVLYQEAAPVNFVELKARACVRSISCGDETYVCFVSIEGIHKRETSPHQPLKQLLKPGRASAC